MPLFPGSFRPRPEQETAPALSCPAQRDVTRSRPAKLRLVTGWTPHMSGKGGEVPEGEAGGAGGGGRGAPDRATKI